MAGVPHFYSLQGTDVLSTVVLSVSYLRSLAAESLAICWSELSKISVRLSVMSIAQLQSMHYAQIKICHRLQSYFKNYIEFLTRNDIFNINIQYH